MTTSITPTAIENQNDYISIRRPIVLGIGLSLGLTATALVILRLYAYFVVVHKGGRPLIAACISWSIRAASTIIYVYSTYFPRVFLSLTLQKIAAATGAISIGFSKIGITLFTIEIQGRAYRIEKWFLISALALNFLSYITMVPFLFVQCGPSLDLPKGLCKGYWKADFWFVWTGYWSAATDIILALYPSIIIWKLQMRRKINILTPCLMGIGIIGAGCGIGKALEAGQLHGSNSMYSLDRIISLVIFNTTEMWLVQIASAAAPLWPLVSHITEKWKSSNASMTPPDYPIHEDLSDRPATGNSPNFREIGASFQRQRNLGQDDPLASSSIESISTTRSLSIHREEVWF